MGEFGVEATAGLLEGGLEIPVAATAECPTCPLPLDQQAHSNGLNATRGQAPGHFFPQQGRQGVSDQTIQDPPGFLGMNQFHVELARLVQSPTDRLLGDLMEHHPLHRHLGCKQLQQMPADAFALPVFISRQQQLISPFEGILQFLDGFFLVFRNHVEGLEIRLGVDAEIGPLLTFLSRWNLTGVVGKITHMPHGGFHAEVLGQESTNGAGLGGALNDDQSVRQRRADNRPPSLSHRRSSCSEYAGCLKEERKRGYSRPNCSALRASCPRWVPCFSTPSRWQRRVICSILR